MIDVKNVIKPKICVLLASYNGERYIAQQIESILQQKDVDIKLFVRDDSSTDNTAEILNKFYNENVNFKIIPSDGRCGSAGKNFYKLLASVDNYEEFDFVAFADQDDIWAPEKSIASINSLVQNKADGCSTNYIAFWDDGRSVFLRKSYNQKKYDYIFESGGAGCTYTFTSKVAAEIKGLIEKNKEAVESVYHHDWLLYSFVRANGLKWTFVEEPMVEYRQHFANETGVNIGLSAIKSRLKKIKNRWYLDQVYAIADVVGYKNLLENFFPKRGVPSSFFYINFLETRRRLRDAMVLFLFFILRQAR